MRPTYHTGDLLLVDRWAYRQQPPQRSDIVVAEYHHGWIVKRVVGLPGELVEVRNGLVEINGIRESASHEVELGFLDIGAGRLLQDRYAVLGDNRGIEPDAFVHAIVSSDQILGKVVFAITWPRSS